MLESPVFFNVFLNSSILQNRADEDFIYYLEKCNLILTYSREGGTAGLAQSTSVACKPVAIFFTWEFCTLHVAIFHAFLYCDGKVLWALVYFNCGECAGNAGNEATTQIFVTSKIIFWCLEIFCSLYVSSQKKITSYLFLSSFTFN